MAERTKKLNCLLRMVWAIVLVAAMLLVSIGTLADSALYTKKEAKMFAEKSGKSQVLCKIPKGTAVTVISKSGKWYEVSYDGKTGFVKKGKLTKKKPAEEEEETPSSEPTPSPDTPPSSEPTPSPEAPPSSEPTPSPEATPSPEPTPAPDAMPSPEPGTDPSAPPEEPSDSEGESSEDEEGSDSDQGSGNGGMSNLDRSKMRARNWRSLVVLGEGGMPIPQLYQSDYKQTVCVYGGLKRSVSTSGCGATCLSMVIAYMTDNMNQDPYTIFRDACQNGMYHGRGIGEAAMARIAAEYGLVGQWRSLKEEEIAATLREGKPIIAHMGKGIFTEGGHYIVLRGVTENGYILINDPNSEARSKYAFPASVLFRQRRGGRSFYVCEGIDEEIVKALKESETSPEANATPMPAKKVKQPVATLSPEALLSHERGRNRLDRLK